MAVTLKNNPWFWACMAVLSAIVANAFIQSCERKGYNETLPPAEQNRTGIINTDTNASRIEAKYRAKLDSIGKAKDKRFAVLWKNYLALEAKSAKAKGRYYAGPKIPACDTVIALQDQQIDSLKLGVKNRQERVESDSLKLTSFAGTLQRKDSVIADLNAGWQEANAENAKLTKQNKRKTRLLKIAAGLIAGLGIIVAAK